MQELPKTTPKLEQFPPRLRRIAEIMTNSIEFYSFKKACQLANVNYDSAKTMISRYRKKGIDFDDLVSSKTIELLRKGKYDVCKSLWERAISGAAADQKLYFQLTDDLVEKQEIKHTPGLSFAFIQDQIPEDIVQERAHEKAKAPVKVPAIDCQGAG